MLNEPKARKGKKNSKVRSPKNIEYILGSNNQGLKQALIKGLESFKKDVLQGNFAENFGNNVQDNDTEKISCLRTLVAQRAGALKQAMQTSKTTLGDPQ